MSDLKICTLIMCQLIRTATVIDGHEVQCIGLANVKMKVKDGDRVLTFLIMPKFSRDILFGLDNLQEIKYSIS